MPTATLPTPTFTPAERELLEPRELLALPDWCAAHRYVTTGPLVGSSGTPVRWRNSVDPLGVTIMAALEDPRWSVVTIMGSPQTSSKTDVAVNLLLSTLHQHRANVFYHNASAVAAQGVWKKKVAPALQASSELQRLIAIERDEGGVRERRDFSNGTSLFLRGSESRAALAEATARLTIADDVQAMRPLPEGDHPVDLGHERADAYPPAERRHVHLGQPGTVEDYLSLELFRSTFYVPFVPCLGCGTYQLLEWDRMTFAAEDPQRAKQECYLRCADPNCTHHIRHGELRRMLRRHLWVSTPPECNWLLQPVEGGTKIKARGKRQKARGTLDLGPWTLDSPKGAAVYPETCRRTRVCGFWRSALYWPFAEWGSLAVQWIEARNNPETLINFGKRIAGIPWKEPRVDPEAFEVEELKGHVVGEHRWKIVPAAAQVADGQGVIIVTSDVQAGYVWYLAAAWHVPTGTGWLLELGRFGKRVEAAEVPAKQERKAAWKSGIITALEGLWHKEAEGWEMAERQKARGKRQEGRGGAGGGTVKANAALALVDCRFMRDTVQGCCHQFNGGRQLGKWLPVAGSQASARGKVPVWPQRPNQERDRRGRRRGRIYYESNTNRGKLYVRNLLAIPPGQPGSFNLPADCPDYPREAFAQHLASEQWDERAGRWLRPRGPNHLYDAMALQVAGAIALGVKLAVLADVPIALEPARPAPPPKRQRARVRRKY